MMCAVSQVYDYGQRTLPRQSWWDQNISNLDGMTSHMILMELRAQREILEKFLAMVEAAKLFDTAVKEPDCEDPQKAAFGEQVRERLTRIEKALGL